MQSYWSSEYRKLDQHMKCNSAVDLPEKNGNSENDVPYSETNGFSNQNFVTVEPELHPVPLVEAGSELTHDSHDAVQKEEAQSVEMICNTDSPEINDAECKAPVSSENDLCDICGEWFPSDSSFHCERLENSAFPENSPRMVEPVLSYNREEYRRVDEKVSDTNPSTQELCPYCNVVYEYEDLSNHISEHSSLPYFCDRCGIFFSREEELQEHERKHGDTVLCLNCFKVCDDAVDLITHTTVRALPLECVLCKNMFLSHCAMHSHKATCSPKKKVSNNVSNQKVKCSQCPMTFASQQRLEDHFRQHTGERPFFCEHCLQTYSRKDNLNRHMRKNRVEDGLTCEYKLCQREFPSACSLKKHYANEHPERAADQCIKVTGPSEVVTVNGRSLRSRIPNNESNSEVFSPQASVTEVVGSDTSNETEVARFSCNFCSKTFGYRKSLTKHVRSVHNQDTRNQNDLPHACHLCSRTFPELILLNRHLNWHKGAQYQCRECGICYSHSKHLQRHVKKVHSGKKDTSNESSSKMTSFCNVIKSETGTSSSVTGSKIIPSLESTKVSSSTTSNEMTSTSSETKNFLTYAELSELIENTPKPYICQVCGKLTDSKRNYLEHYMSHSKERPFKCDVCGQGFIRERRMQDHKVVHERPLKKPKLELEENTHFNSSNEEKFSNDEKIHLRTRVHVTPSSEKSLRPRPHDSTYLARYPHLSFKTPSISLNRFDLYPPTSEGLVQSSSSMVHFRCGDCNRVFSRRSALVSHQRACSDNSPPSTEIPRSRRSKPFKYLMSFEKEDKIVVYGMEHDIFMINGQQHFTCGICGRSFDKKNFIFKHTLIHVRDKPFKCALCLNRGFMTRNSLKKHFRKCHKELTIDKDGNVIQKDGTKVTNTDLWSEPPSEKNVKKSLLADRLTQGYVENDISRSPEQITVECDLSDMMHMFDPDMMVDREEKVETQNLQITTPITSFSQPHYPVHTIFITQPVGVRQFTNDVDMSYVDNYSHYQLNDVTMNHFLESTDIEMEDPLLPFKSTNSSLAAEESFLTCGQCNTSFETKEEMFKHYVAHDMANDPIKCATCDKEFVRRQYLQMHAMMHVRPKKFQCTYCPKSFRAKRDMDDHIRTHTGEKPFACEYCDRKFRVRKQLYAHRKLHVQAFQCAKCSASFSMEWSLKRHEKLCVQGNSVAVSADDGVIIKDVQENLFAVSVDNGVFMRDPLEKVTNDEVVMTDAIKQAYHEPVLHDEAVADVNVTEKGIGTFKCTEDSNMCQTAT